MVSLDVSNKLLISLHYDMMYAVGSHIIWTIQKSWGFFFPVGFTGASGIDSNPAERDKTFKTPNTHLKENMLHWIFVFNLLLLQKSVHGETNIQTGLWITACFLQKTSDYWSWEFFLQRNGGNFEDSSPESGFTILSSCWILHWHDFLTKHHS